MRHEEYKELLALEAAGALEAGERERLDAHLSSCEECSAELRELSDAAASLAYTVASVKPPKALRARVLQSVRDVDPSEAKSRAVDPSEFAARAVDPSELKGTRAVDPSESKGTDLRGLLRRFSLWQILGSRPSLAFGMAAALAAVAALGITTVALLNRNSALTREVSQLYDRLRDAQTETTGVRTQLASARTRHARLRTHARPRRHTNFRPPARARGQGLPTLAHRRQQEDARRHFQDRPGRPRAHERPPPRGRSQPDLRRHARTRRRRPRPRRRNLPHRLLRTGKFKVPSSKFKVKSTPAAFKL